MKESVSIVSPVYNDRKTAPRVLPTLEKLVSSRFKNWEIVLIDDESTDGSREWVSEYAKGKKHIRLYTHDHNQGIAKTYRELYHRAKNDIVVLFSLDGEWDPKDVVSLALSLADNRSDIVIGVRKKKSYTISRRIVSSIYNRITKLFFGVDTRDAGSIKAMRKEVIEKIPIISKGVFDEAERCIRAKRAGYTVGFVNVGHNPAQKTRRGIRITHVIGAFFDSIRVFINTL
jgi:glycosyltransferase involved in cell wall biosynthesis